MNPVRTTHPISLRSILIFSQLRLGLPSNLFPCSFPAKTLYALLFSPCVLHALPSHLPWFYDSNYIWRRVQVIKLLIQFFRPTQTEVWHIKPNTAVPKTVDMWNVIAWSAVS
jgi:hypothetical protein